MDDIYNWSYYLDEGYGTLGDENQDTTAAFKQFFAALADSIIYHYNPKTVLDAGCAVGFLVEALRERGVEAYGFDISADAIAHAKETVRPYLQVSSLLNDAPLENCPTHFDLVTNIEVLEHLYEEDLAQALKKLCSYGDHILFSSSPSDINEDTHFNVRQPEYWVKQFSLQGFFRSTTAITPNMLPDAIYFTKRDSLSIARLTEDYERYVRLLKVNRPNTLPVYTAHAMFNFGQGFVNEGSLTKTQWEPNLDWMLPIPAGARDVQVALPAGLRSIVRHLNVSVNGKTLPVQCSNGADFHDPLLLIREGDAICVALKQSWAGSQLHITANIAALDLESVGAQMIDEFRSEIKQMREDLWQCEQALLKEQDDMHLLREEYSAISSMYHNILHEVQVCNHRYNAISHSSFWRITAPLRFLVGGVKSVVRGTCLRLPGLRRLYPYMAACRMFGRKTVQFNKQHYGTLDGTNCPFAPTMQQALAQEATHFAQPLTFSIACPLYNTPENYLRELIQSVLGQTYKDWELCLADGSDSAHGYVEEIVRKYQKKDARIRYIRLEKNEGIAGNTNAALSMATGDFIALLDHDDVLNINALYETRVAIANESADFVYSDEYTFRENEIDSVIVQHFKPDFAPDNLRANNYICHFTSFKRSLLDEVGGGFRSEYDGSQDFDMVLRLTEKATHVAHVPKLLYCWRSHGGSVAGNISAKPYAITSAIKAVAAHLERVGLKGTVRVAPGLDCIYKVDYELTATPLVSIIIPNHNEADTLRTCLDSIKQKTTYTNYEIIIAENGSTETEVFSLYE